MTTVRTIRRPQEVLEGVAFAIQDSFEVTRSLGISINRTRICKGGAKSTLWKRIFANVRIFKIDQPETEEGPSLGVAMLATVADGTFPSVEAAAEKIVRVIGITEPEPKLAIRYDRLYQKFRQLYPALRKIFPLLRE